MAPQSAVGPLSEAPFDLSVEAVSLPCLHGDVAGKRVEQPEVFVGVVADLPVEVADSDDVKEPVCFNFGFGVGQLTRRPDFGRNLADLVVDGLDFGEERVTALGDDLAGAPKGEVAAGEQQFPGAPVADLGSIQCQAVAANTRLKCSPEADARSRMLRR